MHTSPTPRVVRWLWLLIVVPVVPALGWTSVGPGVEYEGFTLADPNNLFVARMDRDNPAVTIESSIGQGRLSGGTETVGNQAARYDDALSFWEQDWGRRNDIIVAINGDFYNTSNGVPTSGQIHSGWYAKRYASSAFRWSLGRTCSIGSGLTSSYRVSYLATGNSQNIQLINVARGAGEIVLYTPQYDSDTNTDNSGVEVLVEMMRPTLAVATSDPVRGRIRQIRQNQGSTPIPFDHIVLSAAGSAAQTLLANASVGAELAVSLTAGNASQWDHAFASVGGGEIFLQNGFVVGGQAVRHPRTAIAFNTDHVFFVVVDGRSSISVGMTMTELGNFCKDYLDAEWGINLDGGGSSTMLVNGQLKNQPSDGGQRSVSNGMMIVAPQPKLQSTLFGVNDRVRATGTANVRLGPGTNYAVLTSVSTNTQGTILDHSLRGIYAKGFYWWKCDFSSTQGWVAESLLALMSAGGYPGFTRHPVDQPICSGQTAEFNVEATGIGDLSFRWQKDGVHLTEGGRYNDTTAQRLTIVDVAAIDVGSYRCVVTDNVGTATSYSAALLTPGEPTAIVEQPELTASLPIPRGSPIELSVAAVGAGSVSYRWRKDEVNLVDNPRLTGTATQALTILSARHSDGGTYVCRVTAGCGWVDSSPVELAVTTPDFDGDGDADQQDYGHFQGCLTGPTIPVIDPSCLDARLDPDSDVDVSDFSIFQQCYSGPNTPMAVDCPE